MAILVEELAPRTSIPQDNNVDHLIRIKTVGRQETGLINHGNLHVHCQNI